MKCPDCHEEIHFHKEYCPHCSASLFGRNRNAEKKAKEGAKGIWSIVGIV